MCIAKVGLLVLLCLWSTIEIARHRHHRERVGEGMALANRDGSALCCSVLQVAAAGRNDTAKTRCSKKTSHPKRVAEGMEIALARVFPTSFLRNRLAAGRRRAPSMFFCLTPKNRSGPHRTGVGSWQATYRPRSPLGSNPYQRPEWMCWVWTMLAKRSVRDS